MFLWDTLIQWWTKQLLSPWNILGTWGPLPVNPLSLTMDHGLLSGLGLCTHLLIELHPFNQSSFHQKLTEEVNQALQWGAGEGWNQISISRNWQLEHRHSRQSLMETLPVLHRWPASSSRWGEAEKASQLREDLIKVNWSRHRYRATRRDFYFLITVFIHPTFNSVLYLCLPPTYHFV